jgi:hypothetical protein
MIAELQELASLLSSDALTVDQVIARLGAVAQDYGPNVLITPKSPAFKEINIVRTTNLRTLEPTNIPYLLIVTPAGPLALKDLSRAFGEYKNIPAEEKVPAQAIFYLDTPGQPYTVALIAGVKNYQVIKITLRRDKRL